jgi:formamidopyrimidine-DNA glycosylase
MPELPEVQTTVDDLLKLDIIGRSVKQVHVTWPAVTGFASSQSLTRRFRQKKIADIRRRGKYILFQFNDGSRGLLHLRMSGRLKYVPAGTLVGKHEHLRLLLDNDRELRLHDPRKFGRLIVEKSVDDKLNQLGIEPLSREFTHRALSDILLSRRRQLKPLLLDQALMAGLGNICVDESLWMARLHPARVSSSLSHAEIRGLRSCIIHFLKCSIAHGGTSLGDGEQNFVSVSSKTGENRIRLKVYGRTGRPCPRCRQRIERSVVAQRGTHFCPRCQKRE